MSQTAAARYLAALAEHGVEYFFVNAGTDFAPIVEAYADNKQDGGPTLPTPVLCAHENVAGGMAHGAALVTGKPQAFMLHVNVGTGNAVCAVANASRDRIPLLVTAGRSPILESGAVGARDLPIHWSQEMFDQASMVREFVKWDYELRDPRHVEGVVDRAISIANSHPKGPIYLSLPREVLAEEVDTPVPDQGATPVPTALYPDPTAIELLAEKLTNAKFPVIVATASGAEQESVPLLDELCTRFGIGVADPWHRYLNIPSNHPHRIGVTVAGVFEKADVVVFLECDVPWIQARECPPADTFIAQVGVDPLFSTYPMRTHRSDLNVAATPAAFLSSLIIAMENRAEVIDEARTAQIRTIAAARAAGIEEQRRQEASTDQDEPITAVAISALLGELLDEDDIVVNEYVSTPCLLNRTKPGTYYFLPASGGLGWGLPAALGIQYAAPERTVVATLGDGAYMFANPAACHHAAAKHKLPVLTIIANNINWTAVDMATELVYPDGTAITNHEDRFSNLAPSADLAAYCTANGGYGVTVTHRGELEAALKEALRVVRDERRQALVDVRTK